MVAKWAIIEEAKKVFRLAFVGSLFSLVVGLSVFVKEASSVRVARLKNFNKRQIMLLPWHFGHSLWLFTVKDKYKKVL